MSNRNWKNTLLGKLGTGTGLSVAIGAMVVIATMGWFVRGQLLGQEIEKIEISLFEQSHETGRVMDKTVDLLEALSQLPEAKDLLSNLGKDIEKDEKRKTEVMKLLGYFGSSKNNASVYYMTATGSAVVATDPRFVNQNYGFRNYFKEAMTGVTGFEFAVGASTGEPGLYFTMPIFVDEKIVGVIAIKARMDEVVSSLDKSRLSQVGKLMMIDGRGVVIYTKKEGALYKSLGKLTDEEIKSIEKEKTYGNNTITPLGYGEVLEVVKNYNNKGSSVFQMMDEGDNEEELLGVQKIENYPFFLVQEVESGVVMGRVMNVVYRVAGTVTFVVIIVVVIIILLFVKLLYPLKQLEKYAVRVSDGDLDAEVTVNSGDELELLAEIIKKMVWVLKNNVIEMKWNVNKKTEELSQALAMMEDKNNDLEKTKLAILNIMEDLQIEKDRIADEKKKAETILRSIGDAVFVTDEDEKIILMNEMAVKLSGISLYDAMGKNYRDVFRLEIEGGEPGEYHDFVKRAIMTKKNQTLEPKSELLRTDGKRVSVQDSASPISSEDGRIVGCVVVMRDSTKERELQRSKDEFLSVASHQLRTPLGSMRWNLEAIMGGDFGEVGSDLKKAVGEVYEGNRKMIGLVNDLLSVSRIDQGRALNEPEKISLSTVVSEVVKEQKVLAEKRKIVLEFRKNSKLPMLFVDKSRLHEVVVNLLSNAIKYGKVKGWVKVSVGIDKKEIILKVRDNGIGMSAKDKNRLFDKFFRAEAAVKSETEGSGLGLYVVKNFVESWGGEIKVETEIGKGTEFEVRLPKEKVVWKRATKQRKS